MKVRLNYTAKARRYAFEHPLLSALGIQISFWTLSFMILGFIIYFCSKAISTAQGMPFEDTIAPLVIIAVIVGFMYGCILGTSDFYLYRNWSRGKPIGLLIIIKSIYYFLVMVLIFVLIKYVIWKYFIVPVYFEKVDFELPERTWRLYFFATLIYVLFMSIIINFITQVNRRFGPGVLIPILLGHYAKPQEEERAFIFIDLKSSTTHAEKLGHLKYSKFLSECFLEINHLSIKYQAEIYQYVGDEIVLSWPLNGLRTIIYIDFYFACKSLFLKKEKYYVKKYGVAPEFKAGLHLGLVTAVEVGDVKREIAFHGDTLNVTARIQEKCKEYDADLIISDDMFHSIVEEHNYQMLSNGMAKLKGRKEEIETFSVALNEDSKS